MRSEPALETRRGASRFEDAVAVVTGAASGIGRATARRLASEGATVVCVDRADPAEVCAELADLGPAGLACRADVTDPVDWRGVTQRALDAFGRIDVLANVAGIMSPGHDSVLEQDVATWDRVLAVNLRGPWLGMQAVLPTMLAARSGAIVNVASGVALVGFAGLAAYTASKGAIVALTRQAAVEYAPAGVRINAVAPGWTDTPLSRAGNTPEMAALFSETIPVKRVGEPHEIAEVIAFLAAPDAAYVVGQVLAADGGLSAGRP